MRTLIAIFALAGATAAQERSKAPDCKDCGNESYGTTIRWAGSPSEAAARAKEEEKLVFVLHVSGNFEDPRFT
jgi:hypothetical protein